MIFREYPVRCCCQPQKIFGWLKIAQELKAGQSTVVFENRCGPSPSPYHHVQARYCGDTKDGQIVYEVAIYSDDHPIEFWRTIRGFRENVEEAA